MIKTIGELKKAIENIDDDFTIDVMIVRELSEEELKDSKYPYPYEYSKANIEIGDIGYSDKDVFINVYEDGEIVHIKDEDTLKLAKKLKYYEDLEELIGIPLKNLTEICNNKIPEECKNPKKAIVLTDEDVDRWNEYKSAEEQGLLLRLPCRVGDTVYSIANDGKIYPVKATREVRIVNGVLHIICESCRYSDLVSYDDVGKTVFLTRAEAEQKLKEKESES